MGEVVDTEEHVLATVTGSILVLTLNQPAKKNALSLAMRTQLREWLEMVADDVRAVVMTGAGGFFCSGGDLTEVTTREAEARRFDHLAAIVDVVAAGPRPVIASVEGGAYGVGLSLMSACDYVVAADAATFGGPFVKVGLTGDGGISWSLPRRVGPARAKVMLLGGRPVPADQALAWGLVDETVPDGQALSRAIAIASTWAAHAPLAVAATKRALARPDVGHREALTREAETQRALSETADAREAKAAFGARRPPIFRGQ